MLKTVLIIDGDGAQSRAACNALQARSYRVREFADAKGCLRLLRQERPDLLILAVELPAGQNGYVVCGMLKKDSALKSIPVVIVGSPQGFANHQKLALRADGYLGAPFRPEALVALADKLIGPPA
jgi:CheY-like chemotaxis protein